MKRIHPLIFRLSTLEGEEKYLTTQHLQEEAVNFAIDVQDQHSLGRLTTLRHFILKRISVLNKVKNSECVYISEAVKIDELQARYKKIIYWITVRKTTLKEFGFH